LGIDLKHPNVRSIVYWLHVIAPVVAIWLYWLHRLAGPRIKWKVGRAYAAIVFLVIAAMFYFQAQDPRNFGTVEAPSDGENYFKPSKTKSLRNTFISEHTLMNNEYCMQCHQDIYKDWYHSAHRFSSFNNPAYLASIRLFREVLMKRDGNIKASRWCAGCHDPVPLFSGAFDKPNYDDVNDPTAHAGITCVVCHGMVEINTGGAIGNGDYVMDEPIHYPFAYSKNPILKFINSALIKSKPNFHKRMFLKEFHKTSEFCSTCHKVHLPIEVTKYKEFLRGQNHYDAFLLSGVSGVGIRSFYYPPKAQENCNNCHMPPKESKDFGAKNIDDSGKLQVHNHTFLGANTAVAWFNKFDKTIEAHKKFLKGVMRVDIFGVKEGGGVSGKLHAPLRPQVPTLQPGKAYLLETVIRTVKMGHLFTQGTVDSNEVWMEVTIRSGDRVIGRSGAMDKDKEVDRWSHFVNAFVIDRKGNRIARRNAQDIFVALYNHQIPPGAGQVVHYSLNVPSDVTEPIHVELKLNYRKFDKEYMDFIARRTKLGDKLPREYELGKPYRNNLPVVVLARDEITFPVGGSKAADLPKQESKIPTWQRWNDYGIGLLLKKRGELRQAETAFKEVETLKRFDGPLNLARVYASEGRWDEAVDALNRAGKFTNPSAYPWTLLWLSGRVNRGQGNFEEAAKNFRAALDYSSAESRQKGFSFGRDYFVRNLLGGAIYDRALRIVAELPEELIADELSKLSDEERKEYDKEWSDYRKLKRRREVFIRQAISEFERTLKVDVENATAHHSLHLLYAELGENKLADHHRVLHLRYKLDETARGLATSAARAKYPWANHAAEALVIYSLQRKGAPGLNR